jgi:hypothetical protein
MSLHGALMLEGSTTLMLTGPSVPQLPWRGPYYSPDAQMYDLHMLLMWTMPESVLVLDPSVLNNGNQREGHTDLTPAKGRPYYCPYAKM